MPEFELVHVRAGLITPLPALLAVLDLERAGHRIRLDGDDIVVERGSGSPPLDAEALAEIRHWKRHAWLIVRNLLRDDEPGPGNAGRRQVAGNRPAVGGGRPA